MSLVWFLLGVVFVAEALAWVLIRRERKANDRLAADADGAEKVLEAVIANARRLH